MADCLYQRLDFRESIWLIDKYQHDALDWTYQTKQAYWYQNRLCWHIWRGWRLTIKGDLRHWINSICSLSQRWKSLPLEVGQRVRSLDCWNHANLYQKRLRKCIMGVQKITCQRWPWKQTWVLIRIFGRISLHRHHGRLSIRKEIPLKLPVRIRYRP